MVDMVSPHGDTEGHADRLRDALGTCSDDALNMGLRLLNRVSADPSLEAGSDEVPINAALALMESIRPRDELEAALAMQMAGCHLLAMEVMGRARESNSSLGVHVYAGVAAKLARTFTAQIEALARLRGGGQQKIEVRHVHINGNAVIGDVHPPGGGPAPENRDQPLAQGLTYSPGAPVPEVWGADADRDALPVTGDQGTGAL